MSSPNIGQLLAEKTRRAYAAFSIPPAPPPELSADEATVAEGYRGIPMDGGSEVGRYLLALALRETDRIGRPVVFIPLDSMYVLPWFLPVYYAADFLEVGGWAPAAVRLQRFTDWLPVLHRIARKEDLEDLWVLGGSRAVRDLLNALSGTSV